jgi:hypothetical protein
MHPSPPPLRLSAVLQSHRNHFHILHHEKKKKKRERGEKKFISTLSFSSHSISHLSSGFFLVLLFVSNEAVDKNVRFDVETNLAKLRYFGWDGSLQRRVK